MWLNVSMLWLVCYCSYRLSTRWKESLKLCPCGNSGRQMLCLWLYCSCFSYTWWNRYTSLFDIWWTFCQQDTFEQTELQVDERMCTPLWNILWSVGIIKYQRKPFSGAIQHHSPHIKLHSHYNVYNFKIITQTLLACK